MSKHTPGPWTLCYNYRDKMAVIGPGGEDDRICNGPYRADGAGPANMRLIAAAPDLLQGLRNLLDVEIHGSDQPWVICDAISAARAAIAKAEGRK